MKRIYVAFCPPSFEGRHNHVKARLFLGLYLWQVHSGDEHLAQKDVAMATGVSRMYLASRLTDLCAWRYIGRSLIWDSRGRSVYGYHLIARGKKFCDLIPLELRDELLADLKRRTAYFKWEREIRTQSRTAGP